MPAEPLYANADDLTRFHLESVLTEVNCNIGVLSARRLAMVSVPALLGNTFWELWVANGSAVAVIANVICSLLGAVLAGGFIVIMLYGRLHRRRLVGALAVDHLPGA